SQREDREAHDLLAKAERPRAGPVFVLDRSLLADAPPALVRAVFRLVWEREGWPTSRLNFDTWDRLARLAPGAVGAVDLPGGIHVRVVERVVRIERRS